MALHRKMGEAERAHRRERRQKRRRAKPRRSAETMFMDDVQVGAPRGLNLEGIVGTGRDGGGLAMDPQYSWGRKRIRRARQQAAEAAKRA